MNNNVTLDDILSKDGGEAYFLSIYPELSACFADSRKKIKLRDDDKTASGGVFKHKTAGIWLLKDFGAGAAEKAMTAFTLCQSVNKCDASEAFKILAKFYGFELVSATPRATYSSRLPKDGELPGAVVHMVYKDLEYSEALVILSKNAWASIEWGGVRAKDDKERLEMAAALFKYYRMRVLASYEKVNSEGNLVHIYAANEQFPIFCIDEGDFKKIYTPRAEKGRRFLWTGAKPENFVHGLAQHKAFLSSNISANEKAYNEAAESGKELTKDALPERFSEIVLVSGGSDALNVAALGYRVIWLNSESATLEFDTLKAINKLAYWFYNLPDIDAAGRNAAKALALKFIETKTIWLPAELAKRGDGKGGTCKDVRDYLNYYKAEHFKKLVSNALPFKFWDEMPKLDKDGDPVYKFGRQVYIYEFNNVRGYNFMQMNGFWQIEDARQKEGYKLIYINNNIVKVVSANDAKNFIHSFLKQREMPEDLRNVMYNTPKLNEQSLSNLEQIELNFKHYGHDYQFLFFEDRTWKITSAGIEAVKMPQIYVWEDKKLKPRTSRGVLGDFRPSVLEKMFEISQENGGWKVDFKSLDCDFLKFNLQSCKIHWRKELEERIDWFELDDKAKAEFAKENDLPGSVFDKMKLIGTEENQQKYKKKYQFRLDGSLLTENEIAEQTQAFVNRVFVIGYLLHRYKDPTKPWAAYVMDYRISDEGVSNGRAGKGLLAVGLKTMLKCFRIDARDPKIFDNTFLFGGVEVGNELIHMEDWSEFLDFERLFNALSGSLYSNPKGLMPVSIENQDFGKFLIDTNFADRFTSGSAKGRKLWTVFGDYYHEDLEYYREIRTPYTELGQRMFDEWDADEWNRFYNFMGQCLAFYLTMSDKAVKIDPPFANIVKRNSLAVMGENFRQWADTFFDTKMDDYVERKTAFEDFMKSSNQMKISPQLFFKKLIAWCEFMGYTFNPADVQYWCKAGDGKKYGYIKKSMPLNDGSGKYSTVEYVYVRSPKKDTDKAAVELPKTIDETLPF